MTILSYLARLLEKLYDHLDNIDRQWLLYHLTNFDQYDLDESTEQVLHMLSLFEAHQLLVLGRFKRLQHWDHQLVDDTV